MPGLVTNTHLRNQIIDSIFIHVGTDVRLKARGVNRVEEASNLRKAEALVFVHHHPELVEPLKDIVLQCKSTKGHTGNTYVYLMVNDILRALRKRCVELDLQDPEVLSNFSMADAILSDKVPADIIKGYHGSTPEGYNKAHTRSVNLHVLIKRIAKALTVTGELRGYAQGLGRDNRKPEEIAQLILEKYDPADGKRKYSYDQTIIDTDELSVKMCRVNDLIILSMTTRHGYQLIPLTRTHYDRLLDFLRSYAHVSLMVYMAYAYQDITQGVSAYLVLEAIVLRICKIGARDSLLAGEAAKAAADLLRAKLSQTDDLPFNNMALLRATYTYERAEAANSILEILIDSKLDIDIMINLSFAWKFALQADSNIKQDFKDMTLGLESPNPIRDTAKDELKCSLKRTILVAALRDRRQPIVTPMPGYDVPEEVERAVNATSVTEHMLRLITAGSVRYIEISLPDLYPSIADIGHLKFKDKSSSKEGEWVRKYTECMSSIEDELEAHEEQVIKESANKNASNFLVALNSYKGPDRVNKALKVTANDMITSMDESIGSVFKDAQRKYEAITRSLRKIDGSYGTDAFLPKLREWADNNPELLINTAVEPKLGEVHKRAVRIFYMFEKGMKTFLSLFERAARIMDFSIKGAEIVKGDRSREKHMNILSSSHRAYMSNHVSFAVLFDLSKFSQRFNHNLIDAGGEVISELTGYPHFAHISDIFKASLLVLSARFQYSTFTGVAGAFEGFLNFLWTGIHAVVMDIALKSCGRSGDLAAYSDDGLLEFVLQASVSDGPAAISGELESIINSIKSTYADFGLDFNLGKTMVSRVLTEFLGQIVYKGKRQSTWIKEAIKIGRRDENKIIYPICQEVSDIMSQVTASIKAGAPPVVSYMAGIREVMSGPGRRIASMARHSVAKEKMKSSDEVVAVMIRSFFALPGAWGGARIPDVLSSMATSDTSAVSETIYELTEASKSDDRFLSILSLMHESIEASSDYGKIYRSGLAVNTESLAYSTSDVTNQVVKALSRTDVQEVADPLSRRANPALHVALEGLTSIDPTWVAMVGSCCVPFIVRERLLAPDKSSALRSLLTRSSIRRIQRWDTNKVRKTMSVYARAIKYGAAYGIPTVDKLLSRSYPKLHFAPQLPSIRSLASFKAKNINIHYRCVVNPLIDPGGRSSSKRLENGDYTDDLSPPLVTTDISIGSLSSSPDLVTHCTRQLYSYVISAAASGSDITVLVDAMSRVNGGPLVPVNFISSLGDLRKVAVANRKKFIHRVHWSMAIKAQSTVIRSGLLNSVLSAIPHFHYSLVVTVALALLKLRESYTTATGESREHLIFIDPDVAALLSLSKMGPKKPGEVGYIPPARAIERVKKSGIPDSLYRALTNEATRALTSTHDELRYNLMAGRISMVVDVDIIGRVPSSAEPLKAALLWNIIHRLHSVSRSDSDLTGVAMITPTLAPLEGVPVYLADYAIIYHAWSKVHKSRVAKYSKGSTPVSPLDKRSAEDTLLAADSIGLVNSVTLESLQSGESAKTYLALLAGREVGLVYAALDTSSESSSSPVVSTSRAKAVGRALDAWLAQTFEGKKHSADQDVSSLAIMVIRSCVRGSVHRSQPYNTAVAVDWIRVYLRALTLLERVDELQDNTLYEVLVRSEMLENPRWGDISQFDQATKYLRNLYNWGQVSAIMDSVRRKARNLKEAAIQLQSALYATVVVPILNTVRTISYTLVNHAASSMMDFPQAKGDDRDNLVDGVASLTSAYECEGVYDFTAMLAAGAETEYRRNRTPLAKWSARIVSPIMTSEDMATYLAYSYALPFILASGYTGIATIYDPKLTYDSCQMISQNISSYSLPMTLSKNSKEVIVLQGLSEQAIGEMLTVIPSERLRSSFLVVEIPPSATVWSIGILNVLLTSGSSLVVLGLSSDLMGTSLYVIVKDVILPAQIPHDPARRKVRSVDLGLSCVTSYSMELVKDPAFLLSALLSSPLHQAGLPAAAYYMDKNIIVPVDSKEELLEGASLSFVDAPRTTTEVVRAASYPVELTASLIRIYKIRHSKTEASAAIISMAAYAMGIYGAKLDLRGAVALLVAVLKEMPDERSKITFFRVLMDMVNDLPSIPPASYPIASQMAESSMPKPPLAQYRLTKGVKKDTEIIRKNAYRFDEYAETGNPLINLIREHNGEIDTLMVAILLHDLIEGDSEEEELVMDVTLEDDPSYYGPTGKALELPSTYRPIAAASYALHPPDPGIRGEWSPGTSEIRGRKWFDVADEEEGKTDAEKRLDRAENLLKEVNFPEHSVIAVRAALKDHPELVVGDTPSEMVELAFFIMDNYPAPEHAEGGIL